MIPGLEAPLLTLDMQIRLIVRNMVYKLLLNESELQEEIKKAVETTVINFDWQKDLKSLVQDVLKEEVESLMRTLVRDLKYDKELKPLFVKLLKRAVEIQEGGLEL